MIFTNKKIEPTPMTLQAAFDYSLEHYANLPCVSFVEGTPLTYAYFG